MSELLVRNANGQFVGQDGKVKKMKSPNYGLIGRVSESRDIDLLGDASVSEDVDVNTSYSHLNEQKRPDELQLV